MLDKSVFTPFVNGNDVQDWGSTIMLYNTSTWGAVSESRHTFHAVKSPQFSPATCMSFSTFVRRPTLFHAVQHIHLGRGGCASAALAITITSRGTENREEMQRVCTAAQLLH
jgi:hypothetical protein